MELSPSDVDLFHCFDRISQKGVHRLFRGVHSFRSGGALFLLGGANGEGGAKQTIKGNSIPIQFKIIGLILAVFQTIA